MAPKGLQGLPKVLGALRAFASSKDPLTQCLAPRLSRSMATEASLPSDGVKENNNSTLTNSIASVPEFTHPSVLTTIYKFPSMEPLRFESYSSQYLHLPLRRDILHRAIVFEGDAARQGTASSKTRYEVHGSHVKMRPQKGTGMARLGTRQSPLIKGGGKSFGPHPRDFSTELPRKVYDLAWRTALSWRYRKGNLIVCENGMDMYYGAERYARRVLNHNHWGKEYGNSLIITNTYRKKLFEAMEHLGSESRVRLAHEVDVKDLLTPGRIIIERAALDELLKQHQSDLAAKVRSSV